MCKKTDTMKSLRVKVERQRPDKKENRPGDVGGSSEGTRMLITNVLSDSLESLCTYPWREKIRTLVSPRRKGPYSVRDGWRSRVGRDGKDSGGSQGGMGNSGVEKCKIVEGRPSRKQTSTDPYITDHISSTSP